MKYTILALAPVVLAQDNLLGNVPNLADIDLPTGLPLPTGLDLPELPKGDIAELTRLTGLPNPTQITRLPTLPTLPSVSLPTISLPTIKIPSVSIPSITIPSISVPTISLPSVPTKSITFPEFPDFELPEGIELPKDIKPTEPICEGCTSVFHPAHPGIDIDGCDNDEAKGWHWVHSGTPIHTDQPPYGWITSTVTEVHTSTIIDCKPEVKDCPGDSTIYTTIHVPATVTICPVPKDTGVVPTKPAETLPIEGKPIYTVIPKPKATPAYTEGQIWTVIPKPSLAPGKDEVKIYLDEVKNSSAIPVPSVTGGYVAPPAASLPPYPACGHTLCPEVVPGTGVAAPAPAPTGAIVTAGASETVHRAGLAVLAGLLVAMI
ncbi:hypothetical protein B0I35DRAFT_484166 [Stachybotrys elegans]|uniref:Uncharacterized protein n=1 Tax=Stachybotrys elegans TaxID=80388 RepID=A0A8K0SG52_9HYPO|nr:hypothetical protein B0I35DRAFT_484166 [Stachybotrys elegans]